MIARLYPVTTNAGAFLWGSAICSALHYLQVSRQCCEEQAGMAPWNRPTMQCAQQYAPARFEHVLACRINVDSSDPNGRMKLRDALFGKLTAQLARANSGVRPRAYCEAGAAPMLSQTLLYDMQDSAGEIVVKVFGSGGGVPGWFAFLVATIFMDQNDFAERDVQRFWFALFGLDKTRSFERVEPSSVIRGNSGVEQLIEMELRRSMVLPGKAVVVGTLDERRSATRVFHSELSANLKSQTPEHFVHECGAAQILSDAELTVVTYGRATASHSPSQRVLNSTMDKIHVLMLATEWNSMNGGLSTFNRELCKALAKCGARVVCAVPSMDPSEEAAARSVGVTLISADPVPDADERFRLYLPLNVPSWFEPGVVVGHARITGPMAQLQVRDRFPKARRVHFVHMAPEEIEWLKNEHDAAARAEARNRAERDLARGADLVVAVGDRLGREFGSLLIDLPLAIQVFEPGLMMERDTVPPPLDLCLVAGRMDDSTLKGLDIAAEALALLVQRGTLKRGVPELVVRGAQPGTDHCLRKELKVHCLGTDLGIRVRLYDGYQEAIEHDIRRSSVVLMPSRCEGFGLIALEAISMGVPTLISDRSGLAELLRKYAPDIAESMIVRTTNDKEKCSTDWSYRIEAVLADKMRAWDRASQLRERIRASVTWEQSARLLLDRLAALGSGGDVRAGRHRTSQPSTDPL